MKKKVIVTLCLAMFCSFSAGCELNGALSLVNPDCYSNGALTEDEFNDLSSWEKLLYDKNSCGLYEKQSVGNIIDHIF